MEILILLAWLCFFFAGVNLAEMVKRWRKLR